MASILDLVYFDIDGVIADDRHRQHFILDGKTKTWTDRGIDGKQPPVVRSYRSEDYDGYFGELAFDTVWDQGRDAYELARAVPSNVVGFLTGRRVDLRTITYRWLEARGFDPTVLVCKPMHLVGKLAQYKLDVMLADLAVGWNSVTVYDDDPRVIELVNDYAHKTGVALEAIHCTWHVKPLRMQFVGKA